MPKLIDFTGMKFGRLTVESMSPVKTSGKVHWNCRCECGGSAVCASGNLRTGTSTSCGCYKIERIKQTKTEHGRGLDDPTYGSWSAMRARCLNKNSSKHKSYGGRGITICARWDDFENFLNDMGERPKEMTLDRKDVNGNYEPGNCRWASVDEQARNKTNTRLLEFEGESLTLSELSKKFGLRASTIWKRLNRGMSVSDAVKNNQQEK